MDTWRTSLVEAGRRRQRRTGEAGVLVATRVAVAGARKRRPRRRMFGVRLLSRGFNLRLKGGAFANSAVGVEILRSRRFFESELIRLRLISKRAPTVHWSCCLEPMCP